MALALSGNFSKLKSGIRNHHIFGLPAYPSTHIDIAVSGSRARGVHIQTDSCCTLLTVATAAAGDVERDGNDIAHLDVFHIAAGFDDFAGNFVA